MENTLLEAAKQVPSLAVLSVIVWLFIRHIESASASWRATVMDIHRENIEARSAQRETVKENTATAKENTDAMADLTIAVQALTRKS